MTQIPSREDLFSLLKKQEDRIERLEAAQRNPFKAAVEFAAVDGGADLRIRRETDGSLSFDRYDATVPGWVGAGGNGFVKPATPWYDTTASNQTLNTASFVELVPAAGGTSRFVIPALSVDSDWLVSARVLFSAPTANWSPAEFKLGLMDYNPAQGVYGEVAAAQSYGNSNFSARGTAGNDWQTVPLDKIFTIPAGKSYTVFPYGRAAGGANVTVARSPNYGSLFALRVK